MRDWKKHPPTPDEEQAIRDTVAQVCHALDITPAEFVALGRDVVGGLSDVVEIAETLLVELKKDNTLAARRRQARKQKLRLDSLLGESDE